MTDPKMIEELVAGSTELSPPIEPRSIESTPKQEIPSNLEALRTNALVHYGMGVTAKRAGLGWQIHAGPTGQLVCSVTNPSMADFVCRALVGYQVTDGLPPWRCPKCRNTDAVHVIDSRARRGDTRRRRECGSCGERWTSSERIVVP